jgi:hypothetical protein
MWDTSTVVARVISEHHAIRGHIKLAGDTVNDIEALFTLQRTESGWSQTSVTALMEQRDRLLQAVTSLEEGMQNHFRFEEEVLPPLFGELLTKAILHEHHRISGQIRGIRTTLANIRLEGPDQRELLSNKSVVQQDINNLSQTIERHAQHEEIILSMMKQALEEDNE